MPSARFSRTRQRSFNDQLTIFVPSFATNYLIDADNAIIVDVEATTAIRQAEILAAKRMIERSLEHFDLDPSA